MSGIIPDAVINSIRRSNDLGVNIFGIACTLYIPTNLTTLEPNDVYTKPDDITYTEYTDQKVWLEWFNYDIVRLRKAGMYTEDVLPIIGKFKNSPEVILRSYIKVPIRYIPDTYKTDEFEVVEDLQSNTYSSQCLRKFRLAPRRIPA